MNKRQFLKSSLIGAIVGLFVPKAIGLEGNSDLSKNILEKLKANRVIKAKNGLYLCYIEPERFKYPKKLDSLAKNMNIKGRLLMIPDYPRGCCEFPYKLLEESLNY